MNTQDFIEQWNENVAYRIRENDLSHPTQNFMISALLALLKCLNIRDNWSHQIRREAISPEEVQKIQVAKGEFARYVDRLYKVSYPTQRFVYSNLIHPEPKKTFRVLRDLLNYLFFVKLEKDQLVNRVVPVMEIREQLEQDTHNMMIGIEENKIRVENIQKSIQSHRAQIPTLKKQALDQENYLNSVQKDTVKCRGIVEDTKAQIRYALEKLEELSALRVDESDIKAQFATRDELERKANNLKMKEHVMHSKLKEFSEMKNEFKTHIETIEKIQATLGVTMQNYMKIELEVEDLKTKISELEARIRNLHQQIMEEKVLQKEGSTQCNVNQKNLKAKLLKLKKNEQNWKTKLSEKEKQLEKKSGLLSTAEQLLSRQKKEFEMAIYVGKAVLQKMHILRS